MNWTDKKVLVTGAGGFIASHLVERMVAEGARVRAFVRYNSRNDIGMLKTIPPETLAQIEIMRGDLLFRPVVIFPSTDNELDLIGRFQMRDI